MPKRVSIREMRHSAPTWVFPWRRLGEAQVPKVLAVLLVGSVFALFLSTVRVRVAPPPPWAARKASVFHVAGDAVSHELTRRAREGGPFPARVDPSAWPEVAALERAALAAARHSVPPYRPELYELPDESVTQPPLAIRESPVLPDRPPIDPDPLDGVKLEPAPFLYPLSGIRAADLPAELPVLDPAVIAAASGESWRFLVRLDSSGRVRDSISLAGGAGDQAPLLEDWLRRVVFPARTGMSSRWISVGIGFTNRPADDGTDAR